MCDQVPDCPHKPAGSYLFYRLYTIKTVGEQNKIPPTDLISQTQNKPI